MDKPVYDFIIGKTNAVRFDALLSREELPNGVQRLSLKEFGVPDELWGFWYNPMKRRAEPEPVEDDGEEGKESAPKKPKHSGGKPPYLVLMLDEVDKLRKLKDVRGKRRVENVEELIGWLVCLGKRISWHTGLLVKTAQYTEGKKRKRRKVPLERLDLQKLYECTPEKLDAMLTQLQELDLLQHTDEGYFVSSRLIRRGKPIGQEQKTNGNAAHQASARPCDE